MSDASTGLSVDFGAHGGASRLVAVGWSFAEPEFTWTLGEESMVLLERPQAEGDYTLQVTCMPMVAPPRLPMQRVHVLVNRWYAGKQLLREHGTFEVRVGWDVMRDHRHLGVTLLLPDAARPCDLSDASDSRRLGIAVFNMTLLRMRGGAAGSGMKPSPEVQRHIASAPPAITATMPSPMPFVQTGAPLAVPIPVPLPVPEPMPMPMPAAAEAPLGEQMLEFESLGADVEFGLVQRRSGAEPLALLRFAEATLDQVVAALEAGLDGIGAAGAVEITLRGREFMVRDSHYGLHWHSWTYEGQANPRQVLDRETHRLQFLRSKLLQDLQQGHKLLVFKREAPLSYGETERLLAAIARHGPSQLLLVQRADPVHPAGTAERVRPGLLRGYVERFAAAENAEDIATDSWVAMARAAHRVWQSAPVG